MDTETELRQLHTIFLDNADQADESTSEPERRELRAQTWRTAALIVSDRADDLQRARLEKT